MTPAALDFIIVNIALALFYLNYKLFLSRDTFLRTKRLYLKFGFLFSLFLPLINIADWFPKEQITRTITLNEITLPEFTVTPKAAFSWDFETVLLMIYAAVCAGLIIRFAIQLLSIIIMRRNGTKTIIQNTEVIVLNKEIAPFSFLKWIFINPDLHTESELKEILTHESIHTTQMHTGDVFLSELMVIYFWINPFAWLLRREIRQNLEFIADNKVLESGFDSKKYQYHLLQLSYQTPEVKLGNNFNVSPLKKRIIMMNQQKTNKAGLLKYSLVVPLALALIISSNAQAIVSKAKEALNETTAIAAPQNTQQKQAQPVKTEMKFVPPVIEKDKQIFQVVEKMPQYPGGEAALMKYISETVKYPASAAEKNIQGRVIVRFVVNTDGKIEQTEVMRSVDPAIDKEAVRVVNAMPQWVAGEQGGKKVSVYFTLPINFKLDDRKPSLGSIDKNNPPVIFVDDVQMAQDFDISSIKPEEIKSIDVLKPSNESQKAEFIAKYGAQGANGVIKITKK